MENNYLSDKDVTDFTKKYANAKTDAEKEQFLADLKKKDAAHQQQTEATGISVADQKEELVKLKALMDSSECIQNPFPRDLNEKILWNGVKANPSAGYPLTGLNSDPK